MPTQLERDQQLFEQQTQRSVQLSIETEDGLKVDLYAPEPVLQTCRVLIAYYAQYLKRHDRHILDNNLKEDFKHYLFACAIRIAGVSDVEIHFAAEKTRKDRNLVCFSMKFKQAPYGTWALDLPPTNVYSLTTLDSIPLPVKTTSRSLP
jgi:hypothetical protein